MHRTIAELSVCVAAAIAWSLGAARALRQSRPSRPAAADTIHFKAHLEQQAKGEDRFEEKTIERAWAPRETAIVICDMWNQHWCASATRRCGELALKMAPLLDRARERGRAHHPLPFGHADVLSRSPGPEARDGFAGRDAPFGNRQMVLAGQSSRGLAADRRLRRRLRLPAAVQATTRPGRGNIRPSRSTTPT